MCFCLIIKYMKFYNTKTKLDDLDIIINELNILILLCQKTLSLKNLGIKNSQYERELLDFIKFKAKILIISKHINRLRNNFIQLFLVLV